MSAHGIILKVYMIKFERNQAKTSREIYFLVKMSPI